MKSVHKTKRDLPTFFIYFAIVCIALLVVIIGIRTFRTAESLYSYIEGVFFIVIGIFAPTILMIAIIKTDYTFTDECLVLRFGLLKTTIDYIDIYVIKDSRRFFSMFCLATDKLEITVKDKDAKNKPWNHYYVSPIDKDAFIIDLKKHCKNLKVVRRSSETNH